MPRLTYVWVNKLPTLTVLETVGARLQRTTVPRTGQQILPCHLVWRALPQSLVLETYSGQLNWAAGNVPGLPLIGRFTSGSIEMISKSLALGFGNMPILAWK